MSDPPTSENRELREALEELQSYLSDSIPPLFFAGSIKNLFAAPPDLVAAQIIAWAMGQLTPGGQLPTADYIFHAAKKIHMLSELELLPDDVISEFLLRLRPALLEGCPESDRPSLAKDLDRIGMEIGLTASTGVDVVYQRASADKKRSPRARSQGADPVGDDEELRAMSRNFGQGLQKLDYLLSRIDVAAPAAPGAEAPRIVQPEQAATAVSQAAVGLENAQEMEKFLDGLKQRGLPSTPEGLMGLLATNLPDWAPPPMAEETDSEAPQAAVRAMRRFISLAKNSEESQKRFDELVDTAVGEFNKSSLGRAVTLLDLAGSMAAKKEVDGVFAQSVQRRAHSKIDRELLRESMDSEEKHHLLRRFIGFFHQFDPKQLLLELEEEENRDQRRFLLDMLTVHGAVAREAAFADLSEAVAGNAVFPWYYKRNLVHLLRSIPRASEEPIETEIDILVGMSNPNDPLPLLRETLLALGQFRHDRAVTALAVRINEIEEALVGERELQHEPDQLRFLLNSTVKSLVRMSTPEARRCVVAHGLKRQPELGDTLERMTWLSEQDMSKEPDLVDRLDREIRAELPKKVFGLTLKTGKKEYAIDAMMRTLANSNTPAVRELLTEVTRDFAGQAIGETAERILRKMKTPGGGKAPAGPTLSGDLELFGLPNLLQNLADSQIGGVLTVFDRGSNIAAKIWLEKGGVLGAQGARLTGEVAVLQLLEDPAPGRFELGEEEPMPHEARTEETLSIQSILFEGIRRYDEFKRAASVVPDDARYRPAGGQPTLPEGETDAMFFKEVWRRAAAGYSPVECEKELPVDRFRVRCLFEHWLGQGVLAAAPAGATPQPLDSPDPG